MGVPYNINRYAQQARARYDGYVVTSTLDAKGHQREVHVVALDERDATTKALWNWEPLAVGIDAVRKLDLDEVKLNPELYAIYCEENEAAYHAAVAEARDHYE